MLSVKIQLRGQMLTLMKWWRLSFQTLTKQIKSEIVDIKECDMLWVMVGEAGPANSERQMLTCRGHLSFAA